MSASPTGRSRSSSAAKPASRGSGGGCRRDVRQGRVRRRAEGHEHDEHEGNDEHEGDEEEQGEHDEQEGNEAAFAAGAVERGSGAQVRRQLPPHATPDAGSKPASLSRRLHRTRRTERTADSSPVDVDCASQGAALVTHHAIVRATETGARHPACGPHAGGSGGEHIRPQHRAGGQAVPGARISTSASPHDRARFPPLRREGPAPATPLVFE